MKTLNATVLHNFLVKIVSVFTSSIIGGFIQKFPDWVDKLICAYIWYYSFLSPSKEHGVKTHKTDSQNSDTTESDGRELHHLQFSLQGANPETFGYNLVYWFLS
jgi:hypothetical protein